MLNIVIMCGGSGSRLWPLSRTQLPKQFLKLTDKKYTMFQLTCLRVKDIDHNKIIVVCNQEHIFIAKKQLEELHVKNFTVIGEPFGKNTCAPIAVACILSEPESNLLVLSSDNIWDDELFRTSVHNGLKLVEEGIVVFGIQPTYPETGYGYLQISDNNLVEFKEKPDKEHAELYVKNGNYLWNSGTFLFRNSIMTNELKTHAPDIYNAVLNTLNNSGDLTTDQIQLHSDSFQNVRDESIDYAVMEYHKNGKIIVYNGCWKDIGSFLALHEYHMKDCNSNVLDGDIKCIDTHNSFVYSDSKLVTTLGLNNLVIINTKDALLIADKERSQDLKLIVNDLKKEDRSETKFHMKVDRPWGWYMGIDGNDHSGYKVKRIGVYPGKRLSLQSHNHRSEHWVIVKGKAKIQVGKDFHILHSNQSIYIPIGVLHRAENIGEDMVEFIETQIGDYLGEDDIVRYEDDFGRV